jgi:hypothetical protein
MPDVVAKIRAGQPIKEGSAVTHLPNDGYLTQDGNTVADAYTADNETKLGPRFRHRTYYTSGGPDPAGPV